METMKLCNGKVSSADMQKIYNELGNNLIAKKYVPNMLDYAESNLLRMKEEHPTVYGIIYTVQYANHEFSFTR